VRGPVSLLPQKPGRFYRRFPPALLFQERPQDLFWLVLFRKGTHVQKGVKNASFYPDDKAARIRVPERKDLCTLMPLDKTPDDYLEMTEDELKRRKEAFEAYKLQQEVQETLKWKWIAKLGSSLGVVTIVVGIIASLFGLMLNTCSLREEQTRPAIACPTIR
jgi:hypothetical protein